MNKSGFTLLELIIVVAILAVLSTMSYSYYQDSLATARENVVKQNLQMVREAIQRYFQANLQHPTDLAALTPGYLVQTAEKLLVDPLGNATIDVEVPTGATTNLLQYSGSYTWITTTQNKTSPKPIRNVRVRGDSGYLIN